MNVPTVDGLVFPQPHDVRPLGLSADDPDALVLVYRAIGERGDPDAPLVFWVAAQRRGANHVVDVPFSDAAQRNALSWTKAARPTAARGGSRRAKRSRRARTRA